jgi:hypothetical protein
METGGLRSIGVFFIQAMAMSKEEEENSCEYTRAKAY